METWLEAFEERAAIIEFDAGLPRLDADTAAAHLILAQLIVTGARPGTLLNSRYRHHFASLSANASGPRADRAVREYRWSYWDNAWCVSQNYYTEDEAAVTFRGRPHHRQDATQRPGRRAPGAMPTGLTGASEAPV